ncbi:MAG: InlB B-repeat-containing protein [Paludibacteraceae bacterium]|nr:InlB B-repeat-containing protein [Paludibacteraceae bacterium]
MIAAEPNLAINTESQGTEDFVKAYEAEGITLSSTASFSSGAVQLGNTPSSYDQHYFEVLAGSAEIDSISFLISGNGSNKNIQAPLFGWAETATSNTADTYVLLDPKVVTANSYAAAQWFTYDLSKAEVKCARIYRTTKYVSSANPEYTGSSTALGTGQTIKIYGLKVWLKETKTIVSTVETLTNAKINGVALDPNFLSELIDTKSVEVFNAYTTAPTVTFTKHVVITYDDKSTKQSDVDVEVVAEALGSNQWTAKFTLGDNTYSVTMQRAAAYTVTYKEGEQVLGTELVAANGNPAEFAKYEKMPLATFDGWFKDAELTQKVESMAAEVISADVIFYAKFSKAYAQSIDFEQMVLNNGKSYDVKSALTANFYDYKTIDALDSLNNSKGAARNEPYLGLKIKKQGGYLACNVLPGTTIRIKFGYVAETVLAIAGNDTMRLVPTDNKIAALQFPIAVETLVKLQTTSDKTVVIKQIMVDEPLVTWMYPITYAEAENGKVEGWTIAFPDETVELTVTPNEGYKAASVTAGNEAVVPVEDVYSFVMPGQAVTVAATFVEESGTGITNTEAAVKAVKVVREGKLFIEKNGVLYNAQGNVVK